jgi:hypothetical protein
VIAVSEAVAVGFVLGVAMVVFVVWVVVTAWLDRRRDAREDRQREAAWRYGEDR